VAGDATSGAVVGKGQAVLTTLDEKNYTCNLAAVGWSSDIRNPSRSLRKKAERGECRSEAVNWEKHKESTEQGEQTVALRQYQ
jgi:hypothetical protein